MPSFAMVFYHMTAFSELHMIKFNYVSEDAKQLHTAGITQVYGQISPKQKQYVK